MSVPWLLDLAFADHGFTLPAVDAVLKQAGSLVLSSGEVVRRIACSATTQ